MQLEQKLCVACSSKLEIATVVAIVVGAGATIAAWLLSDIALFGVSVGGLAALAVLGLFWWLVPLCEKCARVYQAEPQG